MNRLWIVAAVAPVFALGACAGDTVNRTGSQSPTVTYSYGPEDDFDDIEDRADDYCDDNYNRRAVFLDRDSFGNRYEATFSCE